MTQKEKKILNFKWTPKMLKNSKKQKCTFRYEVLAI